MTLLLMIRILVNSMIVAIMVIVVMTAYILCWSDARFSKWVMPEMPGLIIAKSFKEIITG